MADGFSIVNTVVDKYQSIRDLTDEDRRDIHEFAVQRSEEMIHETD